MFVSFEGLDGSGKTTQAELLRDHLTGLGRDVVAVREPGGTELGERVRELVLGGTPISPWAEAALFAAARAELVERVVKPALARGADVVCDRFVDSSLAYQGVARGLGIDRVLDVNMAVIDGVLPHRTFVLLLDAADAAARRGGDGDRIESEGIALQTRVADAYREVAARFPERIEVVDGALPPEQLAEVVRSRVEALL